jgi:RHS repeat-associated protein
LAPAYDEAGNRTQKVANGVTVTYTHPYGSDGNRLTAWSSTTNFPADLLQLDVSGTSSETIGTNSALGALWVSNVVAVTPSVSGTGFTVADFQLRTGQQEIVAAIGDAAGNVGVATSTITVVAVTNTAYGFDQAGNVTSIVYRAEGNTNTWTFSWNGRYELVAAAEDGVMVESNKYDALGRRIAVVDADGTNWFVLDGAQVVADLDATGKVLRTYVWGPGIDNLLAMTVHTGAVAKTYYALTDHLGSVHALADDSGVVTETYRFDAWGRVLSVRDGSGVEIAESTLGNRYLWQGREYSWKTKLYYFRTRWYDPVTGRFLSNDPIGINGGLNQYVFCGNNPVNFTDPFGLCEDNPKNPWQWYKWFIGNNPVYSVFYWGQYAKYMAGPTKSWPYAHVLATSGIANDWGPYWGAWWATAAGQTKELSDTFIGIPTRHTPTGADRLLSAFQPIDFQMNNIGINIVNTPGVCPETYAEPFRNTREGAPGPVYNFFNAFDQAVYNLLY